MIGRRNRNNPSERDLVALADGSLSAARRARVERAVAASPELREQLSDQRRALAAIRGVGEEPMPVVLRARLELSRRPDPAPRSWYRLAAGATTGAVAAAALSAAVILGLGGAASPTVAAAATLGTRVPIAATGAAVPGVSAAGLSFPDWSYRFGLKAEGTRHDALAGRTATTVFYVGSGGRIAYTIVSGVPLRTGATAHGATWNGVRLSSFSSGRRAVVTWTRDGHTCVLSGPQPLLRTMMALASWNGDETQSGARSALDPANYAS